MSRNLKVAVVQHSNTADYAENLAQSIAGIRRAAAQGAQLVMLQELHTGLYFCQVENTDYFDLAETIPGASTTTLGALAAELRIVIVCSLFEKRATGLITIPLWCWIRMAALRANTARCTFLTIPVITKSFTSPPATLVLHRLKPAWQR